MTLTASNPIDLAAGRTIVIRQGSRAYTLNLRRAEEQDWFTYFDAIISTAEQHGREVTRETDASSAGLDLVATLLQSAEGYALPAGVATVAEISDWQSKIPMAHRLGCAEVLLDVRAVDADDDTPLTFGGETVTLEAKWTADEAGRMRVQRTVHNFSTPTAEHCRTYMRQISRSKVVGGSRSGKTIYSGGQRVLCGIYDELIQSVEGYIAGNSNLGCTREIAYWMDARHKVAAAARLFATAESEE